MGAGTAFPTSTKVYRARPRPSSITFDGDPSKSLADYLQPGGLLGPPRRRILDELVARHLRENEDDAARTLVLDQALGLRYSQRKGG